MKKLLSVIVIILLVTACGKPDDEKRTEVIQETLKCSQGNCSSKRMNCHRTTYYSDEMKCTIIFEIETKYE